MKKLLLILILGIGLLQTSQAQYFFNKRETLHSLAANLTSVIPRDGKYYCTGITLDSSNIIPNTTTANSIWGVRFTIFDSIGNILRDTLYQTNTNYKTFFPWNNSLYSMPDKGFILGIDQEADSGHYKMAIMRFDSIGNMLWYNEYPEPFCSDTIFYSVTDFKPTGTGEWLTLATIQCPYGNTTQTDFALTKLDSNFNVEWSKEYGDPTLVDDAGKLLITNDGYVMVGGRSNANIVIQAGFTNQGEIIKTDTAGNQQWVWLSDTNKQTNIIQDIIQTPDGGYVYCGEGNGYETDFLGNGTLWYKGWVEKLDSNRNILWNDTFSAFYDNNIFNSLNVLKLLPDSTIMVAGMVIGGFDPNNTTGGSFGALIKLDEAGQVLWERTYSYNYPADTLVYQVFDMKPTPDKGFVFCGQANNFYDDPLPNQRGWIVKVDSNGCLGPGDPQCNPLAVKTSPILSKGEVKLWPNPVTGAFNVRSAETGELMLFDMVGKIVAEYKIEAGETNLQLPYSLASGVYVGKFVGSDGDMQVVRIVKQ